jgi:hypothetical protein
MLRHCSESKKRAGFTLRFQGLMYLWLVKVTLPEVDYKPLIKTLR